MGTLTETESAVLRYVRGRVARREIQQNTAGRVRSILMGFAHVYGRRPLKLIGRKHIELCLDHPSSASCRTLAGTRKRPRHRTQGRAVAGASGAQAGGAGISSTIRRW